MRSPWRPRVAVFLGSEALSAIGSWATVIAIWGYAAYEFDASPGEVALFGLSFSVPGVVLGPIAGEVVDRIGPKTTLAFAKVLGVAGSVALLSADDFVSLAVLSAVHGVASAFSLPALQALPPRLVDDQYLARTNALVSLTDELAIVLGPLAGGASIAAFGFRGAFVFDAITYGLGLLVLPLVRLAPVEEGLDEEDGDERAGNFFHQAMDGWRLVVHRGVLRRTVACTFAVHMLYGLAFLGEPLYVRDVLHRSEEVFAALQTAFGICLVTGGLLAARLGERLASFGWVALGVLGSGLTAIVYLGTPWVVVAFVGVALWGVATALISGPSRTVLQRGSPMASHGRVLAADLMAGNTAILVGIGVSGVLISLVGVQWSVVVQGLGVAAVAALLYLSDRRDRAVEPHLV